MDFLVDVSPQASIGTSMDLFNAAMNFQDEILSQPELDYSQKAIFANNRGALCFYYMQLTAKDFDNLLLQELYNLNKEYGTMDLLPHFGAKEQTETSILTPLLQSLQMMTLGKIPFHQFVTLDKVHQKVADWSDIEVQALFDEPYKFIPLMNIVDFLLQSGDSSMRQFGLQYLNLAEFFLSKGNEDLVFAFKGRLETLRGAQLLDRGIKDPASKAMYHNQAEKLLSSFDETPNFHDYLKEANASMLALMKFKQGSQGEHDFLSERAKTLKNLLNISDIAPEFASFICVQPKMGFISMYA